MSFSPDRNGEIIFSVLLAVIQIWFHWELDSAIILSLIQLIAFMDRISQHNIQVEEGI